MKTQTTLYLLRTSKQGPLPPRRASSLPSVRKGPEEGLLCHLGAWKPGGLLEQGLDLGLRLLLLVLGSCVPLGRLAS